MIISVILKLQIRVFDINIFHTKKSNAFNFAVTTQRKFEEAASNGGCELNVMWRIDVGGVDDLTTFSQVTRENHVSLKLKLSSFYNYGR